MRQTTTHPTHTHTHIPIMNELPIDVFQHIASFLAPTDNIGDIFKLLRVHRRWRYALLQSPSLWSTIRATSKTDPRFIKRLLRWVATHVGRYVSTMTCNGTSLSTKQTQPPKFMGGVRAFSNLVSLTLRRGALKNRNVSVMFAARLDSLRSLDLGDNCITSVRALQLQNMTSLVELNIGSNRFCNGEEGDWWYLSQALSYVPNLEKLDVSYAGDVSMTTIALALSHLPKLNHLDVSGLCTSIKDNGPIILAAKLVCVPELRSLNVGFNYIETEDATESFMASLINVTKLTSLNIDCNDFNIPTFMDSLSCVPNLEELNISRNAIFDDECDEVDFCNVTKLTSLSIAQTMLSLIEEDKGVEYLVKSIGKNLKLLRYLDISDNDCFESGDVALNDLFDHNNNIKITR